MKQDTLFCTNATLYRFYDAKQTRFFILLCNHVLLSKNLRHNHEPDPKQTLKINALKNRPCLFGKTLKTTCVVCFHGAGPIQVDSEPGLIAYRAVFFSAEDIL